MNLSNILRILKQKFYNKDVVIFFVFLLLALFVWFLNKLSHDYLYTMEYPVELYSTKENQITFDEKETILTIQQRMDGFSILKSKVTRPPTVRIDLGANRYYRVPSSPNTYYTLTKNFTDMVDHQIGDDRQLITINPDTLYFTVGVLAEKKVPIRHQLELTTEKEYMLKEDIILKPDSITIAGSQAVIDEVAYVAGTPLVLANLTESVKGSFGILPIKGVHISKSQVQYSANIIRYTEGILKTAIVVKDLPSGIAVTLLPHEIELRFRVAVADFSTIDTSQFVASISYNDITENGNDRTLAVQLTSRPKEVLSVQIIPPFVEYIIRKN